VLAPLTIGSQIPGTYGPDHRSFGWLTVTKVLGPTSYEMTAPDGSVQVITDSEV
jgi:hypothetical protein